MGYIVDGINYTGFPNQLSKEQLDKLNTNRLLCYFRKFRSAYYSQDLGVQGLTDHFNLLKDLLSKRSHV